MQLELLNDQGQATSKYDAPETVFGRAYNEDLVHQVVVAFQANARQGTRAQKDREQVKHSTKKPFKQKGTGRARAGMTSSPLWRGGGRIFPNMPDENFAQKINKKMYRAGMASILSQLAREGRLAVVDSLTVDSPKTKALAAKFKAMGLDSVLVITDQLDDNLLLASRNLVNVLIVEPRHADPLALVHYKKVLVTKAAMEHRGVSPGTMAKRDESATSPRKCLIGADCTSRSSWSLRRDLLNVSREFSVCFQGLALFKMGRSRPHSLPSKPERNGFNGFPEPILENWTGHARKNPRQ